MRIERLGLDDLDRVLALDVFDGAPRRTWTAAFLEREDNVLLVATADDGAAVGMLTATRLHHPDKPPELLVREVGVEPAHRRVGVASALVRSAVDLGAELGCSETWLVTESGNTAAGALYDALGGDPDDDAVLWTWRATTD